MKAIEPGELASVGGAADDAAGYIALAMKLVDKGWQMYERFSSRQRTPPAQDESGGVGQIK